MLGLARGRRRGDPNVRGFTRVRSGLIGKFQSTRAIVGYNAGTYVPVNYLDGLDSVYVQGGGTVQYSNPGGYYMNTAGLYLNRAGDPNGSFLKALRGYINIEAHSMGIDRYKAPAAGLLSSALWIEYRAGVARVWGDGYQFFAENVDQHSLIGVGAFTQADANPDNDITGHKSPSISSIVAMRRRDIELVNIPDGGYVLASVNGAAAIRVNANDQNGGLLVVPDGIAYPVPIVYEFHDATGAISARFKIAQSWGGDIIGNRTAHMFDPANFAIVKTTSGLLFYDDFSGYADGPLNVPAKYQALSGAWTIAGGKLTLTNPPNGDVGLKLLALSGRKNQRLQVALRRSNLALYATQKVRDTGGFWYQLSTGATTGGNAGKPEAYSYVNGQYFAFSVGASAAQSGAIGERVVMTEEHIDAAYRFALGGLLRAGVDNGPAAQVAGDTSIRVQYGPATGGTVTFEKIVSTTSRMLTVRHLPVGWKARAGGVTSAASDGVASVTIDTADAEYPLPLLEILDDAGNVKGSAAGIYGGDTYSLS